MVTSNLPIHMPIIREAYRTTLTSLLWSKKRRYSRQMGPSQRGKSTPLQQVFNAWLRPLHKHQNYLVSQFTLFISCSVVSVVQIFSKSLLRTLRQNKQFMYNRIQYCHLRFHPNLWLNCNDVGKCWLLWLSRLKKVSEQWTGFLDTGEPKQRTQNFYDAHINEYC